MAHFYPLVTNDQTGSHGSLTPLQAGIKPSYTHTLSFIRLCLQKLRLKFDYFCIKQENRIFPILVIDVCYLALICIIQGK